MSPTVTVRGRATVPARPDQVRLQVEVEALAATPGEALDQTARKGQALEAILDALAVPEEARTTSGVTVAEETEYDGRRVVRRGYRARNSVQIRLSDPAPLGELMKRAADDASARINGPWWSVAEDNPARIEACRAAASFARQKAAAYAEATGHRLGALVEVVEAGARPPEPPGIQPQVLRAAAAPAAAEVEVHPGKMEVSAAVDVTFNLEEP